MIHFAHVTKRFPARGDALRDVSFVLEAGELAYLTGHSGAGKSTLLKLIGLLERPTRGQISVNGSRLGDLSSRQIPYYRRQIGMIFQDHRLLPDRTVFDNVALPLLAAGLTHRDASRRVRASLDQVGLLRLERALPIALSGGEQQRVGIARAVVARPPVILADEPTGNLDPQLSKEIFNLFQRFNDIGVTLLIATHNLPMIQSFPARTLRLTEGRLVSDTRPW